MTVVYAFPGQGSQSPGMGLDLVHAFPLVAELADQASEALGVDMRQLVEDETRLAQTAYTQPALLWAGFSCYAQWRELGGPQPDFLCGHSLGEYTALVAAGVLDFGDAVALVHQRGKLMQDQVPASEALMAAVIGLDDARVQELCAKVCKQLGDTQALYPANYNAAGQVVVAGRASALEPLQKLGKTMGAKRVLQLQMSVPSHCMLMREAAEALAEYAESIEFRDAVVPVVQNLDAKPAVDGNEIRTRLIDQLTHSVLWRQTMEQLRDTEVFFEAGPGQVLQGLARRALPDAGLYGLGSFAQLRQAAERHHLHLPI